MESAMSESTIRYISFVKVSLIYEPNYACTNILLIDDSVQDYQTIVDSVNSNTMAIIYSYLSTKEDLSNVLSNFTNISRVAFVFSSNSNNCPVMFLDNQPLFSFDNLIIDNNSENLLFLINIFQKYNVKNVDYLACNTLNYSQWNDYYTILKNIIVKDSENQETTVIIGASNDTTGNIKYGGDWILENTSEDIENMYFTQNINYYEYLLDNATWLITNSNSKTAGIVTMYDSVTTKNIMFVSSGYNFWGFGCNFPPTTGANNWNNGSEFGITADPLVYGMTVFTSAFSNTATNKQFVIAALSTGAIGYFYNFVLHQNTSTTTQSLSGSISTNSTWLATGATMATTTNLALYNNRLFYSLKNGNIGSAIITDATVPTIGSNNVAYINTTLLSSSASLYPIGLTTDTNGYLYAALGNVSSAATTGVIKVINVTSTPTLAYTISLTTTNISNWGNSYALIWNSDKLYIGTTVGAASSSTVGNILLCNTLSGVGATVTSTLTAFKTGTKCIGGMAITGSSLYTSSLNSASTTVSQYDIVVTTVIPTVAKGFYNQITDIVGNFSSITQLTSFPTFNGISNFSTRFLIKNAGVDVDLALLYALNSTPIVASYNTSMYTYVGVTKYDLSALFAPIYIAPAYTPVTTTTTWSGTMKGGGVTVSSALISCVTTAARLAQTGLSALAITTNNSYMYSITIKVLNGVIISVGFGNSGMDYSRRLGYNGTATGESFGMDGNGNSINSKDTTTYSGPAFNTVNQIVDVAINTTTNYWWVRVDGGNWNNTAGTNPISTSSGYAIQSIIAAAIGTKSLYFGITPGACSAAFATVQLNATSTYPVPSGYTFVGY